MYFVNSLLTPSCKVALLAFYLLKPFMQTYFRELDLLHFIFLWIHLSLIQNQCVFYHFADFLEQSDSHPHVNCEEKGCYRLWMGYKSMQTYL